jgi:hypothetical protein
MHKNHNEEPEKPDHHEWEKNSRKGRFNHKWRDKKKLQNETNDRHSKRDEDYDDEEDR